MYFAVTLQAIETGLLSVLSSCKRKIPLMHLEECSLSFCKLLEIFRFNYTVLIYLVS